MGSEEGVVIQGKAIVTGPSREEFEEHMRTHMPFRNWCAFCVKGKSKSDAHRKRIGEHSKISDDSTPVIGIDHLPKTKGGEQIRRGKHAYYSNEE